MSVAKMVVGVLLMFVSVIVLVVVVAERHARSLRPARAVSVVAT